MTASDLMTRHSDITVRIESLRLDIEAFSLRVEDWSAHRGECIAFVGHNGSGKTTVLDSLLGLRKDARLRGSLLGHSVRQWRRKTSLRQRLGVLLQRASFPEGLYVREIIALHRSLYSRSSVAVLDALGLEPLRDREYTYLSRGEQQRVDLFMALAHEPELIVLDEPFTGLDSRFARITAALLETPSSTTVLMACHSELELSLADTMVWMDGGAIRATGHPQDVRCRLLGDYRLSAAFHHEDFAREFAATLSRQLPQVLVGMGGTAEVVVAGDESLVRSVQARIPEGELQALRYGPTSLGDLLNRCAHGERAPTPTMPLAQYEAPQPEARYA